MIDEEIGFPKELSPAHMYGRPLVQPTQSLFKGVSRFDAIQVPSHQHPNRSSENRKRYQHKLTPRPALSKKAHHNPNTIDPIVPPTLLETTNPSGSAYANATPCLIMLSLTFGFASRTLSPENSPTIIVPL